MRSLPRHSEAPLIGIRASAHLSISGRSSSPSGAVKRTDREPFPSAFTTTVSTFGDSRISAVVGPCALRIRGNSGGFAAKNDPRSSILCKPSSLPQREGCKKGVPQSTKNDAHGASEGHSRSLRKCGLRSNTTEMRLGTGELLRAGKYWGTPKSETRPRASGVGGGVSIRGAPGRCSRGAEIRSCSARFRERHFASAAACSGDRARAAVILLSLWWRRAKKRERLRTPRGHPKPAATGMLARTHTHTHALGQGASAYRSPQGPLSS